MLKSLIAAIVALLIAPFGVFHHGVAASPGEHTPTYARSTTPDADTGEAASAAAAAEAVQQYPAAGQATTTPNTTTHQPQILSSPLKNETSSENQPSVQTNQLPQNPFLGFAAKADLASTTAALQSEIAAIGTNNQTPPVAQAVGGGNFENPNLTTPYFWDFSSGRQPGSQQPPRTAKQPSNPRALIAPSTSPSARSWLLQFPSEVAGEIGSIATDVVTGGDHVAEALLQNFGIDLVNRDTGLAAAATPIEPAAETTQPSASAAATTSSPAQPIQTAPKPNLTAPSFQDLSSNGSDAGASGSSDQNPTAGASTPAPASAFVSQDEFDAGLATLDAQFQADIGALSAKQPAAVPQQVAGGGNFANPFAAAQSIDNLSNTSVSNPTVSGGSISNASISGGSISGVPVSATALSASGDTDLSGNLAVGGALSAGALSFTAASSTGIIAQDATITAATTTSLYAAFGNIGSALISTLNTSIANIVGLTATNATTTNATTTNLYAASAVIIIAGVYL